jgi:hypothetical protein
MGDASVPLVTATASSWARDRTSRHRLFPPSTLAGGSGLREAARPDPPDHSLGGDGREGIAPLSQRSRDHTGPLGDQEPAPHGEPIGGMRGCRLAWWMLGRSWSAGSSSPSWSGWWSTSVASVAGGSRRRRARKSSRPRLDCGPPGAWINARRLDMHWVRGTRRLPGHREPAPHGEPVV